MKTLLHMPRNEQGIALLIALAVLVLMAILAVAFYTSQDIESMAALNARAARSAEAIAEGGLEWAISLIESDETPGYDTNFDIWGPRAKDAGLWYSSEHDMLFNNGSDNEVDLSDLVEDNDARWIEVGFKIGDVTRPAGRIAVIIECESGKANLNVVGNAADGQAEGINPAEVSLHTIIGAIPDTEAAWPGSIIDARNGGDSTIGGGGDDDGDGPLGCIQCDDDLDGTADPDDTSDATNEPDERNMYAIAGNDIAFLDLSTVLMDASMTGADEEEKNANRRKALETIRDYVTVNSRTQNVYPLNPADADPTWRNRLCVNLDATTAQQIRDELGALDGADRLPTGADVDLDQIAANIRDFTDGEASKEPTELNGKYGLEQTPYLNEIETSPKPYPATYDGRDAMVYDHGEFIEVVNPYEDEAKVKVQAPGLTNTGGNRDVFSDPVDVEGRSGDDVGDEGYAVIGDTSARIWLLPIPPETPGEWRYVPNYGDYPLGCDSYMNLDLESNSRITLSTNDDDTIEIATQYGSDDQGSQTAQKDDPRARVEENWKLATDTMGKFNSSTCKPSESGDEDGDIGLSNLYVIYNGPVGSIGHLGRVHTGQPWQTIDLTGEGVTWDTVHTTRTWLNIYDAFTTWTDTDPEHHPYGLININTAPSEVLAGLKGVDASGLYSATQPGSGTGRVIESIGELGEYLDMSSGSTTWDREKHLADVAGLVTVRSHVFRVTVRAQALDRQRRKIAERRLEASVLREVELNDSGEPTGVIKVRVLSMRWLSED